MWDHQREAVEFARSRKAVMYHMGLGTGKSRCAIEVIEEEEAHMVLILCPLSVVPAWEKQFRLFAKKDWQMCLLRKGAVKRKTKLLRDSMREAKAHARPLVVVVNYESARCSPLAEILMKTPWDVLVCDEIHRLKSPGGKTSLWAAKLSKGIPKRLGLSGTIMPHDTLDVYAQFRTLCGGDLFGWSFVRFRSRYSVMGGWNNKERMGDKNLPELRSKMATCTYQAERSVLNLPDAIHQTIEVELSKDAQRIYSDLSRTLRAQVECGEVTAANALVRLLRLQQLTSGVATIDGDPPVVVRVDESKQGGLSELIDFLEPDEPLVVFGKFIADLESVHAAAAKAERGSLELSGRRKELEEWQAGKAPILAVQIQAGGVGVDLTRASYCVYLSTGFSLGDYEQSLARVHRPGQDRTVFYYHLVAANTVDVQVFHALRARKDAVEAVLADLASADSLEPTMKTEK